MKEKFTQRLSSLLAEREMKQADLAKLSGIRASSISDWLSGKYAPKQDKVDVLAKALNVSPAWLMGYGTERAPESSPKVTRIPLLGVVAAGVPMEAIENIEDYEEIPAEWGTDRDYFALRVKGDSMDPVICNGDRVIVRKQPCIDSGQIAVVMVNGWEATVKKVRFTEKGLTLIGINAIVYPPHFYTAEEVEKLPITILGRVVEVRRSLV